LRSPVLKEIFGPEAGLPPPSRSILLMVVRRQLLATGDGDTSVKPGNSTRLPPVSANTAVPSK
jgi:hypothetical protein